METNRRMKVPQRRRDECNCRYIDYWTLKYAMGTAMTIAMMATATALVAMATTMPSTADAFTLHPSTSIRTTKSVGHRAFAVLTRHFASRDNGDDPMQHIGIHGITNARGSTHNSTRAASRRDFLKWNSASAVAVSTMIGSPSSSLSDGTNSQPAMSSPPINSEAATRAASLLDVSSIPFSTTRKYKSIKLSNGLEVLLVHDRRQRALASAALTIRGAGQFYDTLDGIAHLMEHMVLSSPILEGTSITDAGIRFIKRPASSFKDFEEWLIDYDGASNGFTAYEKVCFHFTCPPEVFSSALQRFACLFRQSTVQNTCQDRDVLRREVRRVNSELNFRSSGNQELYLFKSLMNPNHPFSRISAGTLESLEFLPNRQNVDVSAALIDFFRNQYLPQNAVLVVVAPMDVDVLKSWVMPFANTLSLQPTAAASQLADADNDIMLRQQLSFTRPLQPQGLRRTYPPAFLPNKINTPICLYRPKSPVRLDENVERIIFHWPLELDYSRTKSTPHNVVSPAQVAFCLSQIFGRKGPGSLYLLLKSQGWIPDGSQSIPRFSFPVEVSGFQVLKMELHVTTEGFVSRAAVIAAVYDAINVLRDSDGTGAPFVLKRALIAQYAAVAELYGYRLSPRPPDAIELAFDAQTYGVDGPKGVGTAGWHRFPSSTDLWDLVRLQRSLAQTLMVMSDVSNAVIFTTASKKSILAARNTLFDDSLPRMSPASWDVDGLTGARYYYDDAFRLPAKPGDWLIKQFVEDELSAPQIDPLVPPSIRLARNPLGVALEEEALLRQQQQQQATHRNASKMVPKLQLDLPQDLQQPSFDDITSRRLLAESSNERSSDDGGRAALMNEMVDDPSKLALVRDSWSVLKVIGFETKGPRLRLPPAAPEPSCRSVFILQMLSTRPAEATPEMAACAELWKLSFESAVSDLAELGVPGALGFEISFNRYGMRIAFLGISQNIASYARRLARRLVDHPRRMSEKQAQFPPGVVDAAIRRVNREPGIPGNRKRQIVSILRDATPMDAGREATAFFRSCAGGTCVSQGDLLPKETIALLADLKTILRVVTGSNISPTPPTPAVKDVVYNAMWVPRFASLCSVPGTNFVSDACGRIAR